MRLLIFAICLLTVLATSSQAQEADSKFAPNWVDVSESKPSGGFNTSSNEFLPLAVPKGTAMQIVLDKEVRIQKVGQEVRWRWIR
jgi:hypothetical protein